MIPQLSAILPWSLIAPNDEGSSSLIEAVIIGAPLPSMLPVVSILVLVVIFITVAIWRFEQEEF